MKKKKFDCVEMKNEIQRKLQAEYEGLSSEERRRRMTERILSDPVLGPAFRDKLKNIPQRTMMVAENEPEYRMDRKGND
ncbi:MAG: hypothetical protein ABFR33_01190 [Verrucomicrobiota bacterium]